MLEPAWKTSLCWAIFSEGTLSKRAVGNMACKSVEAFSYVVLFVMCAVFSPEGPEAYDWASRLPCSHVGCAARVSVFCDVV